MTYISMFAVVKYDPWNPFVGNAGVFFLNYYPNGMF